jgi:hypothetical protein
MESTVPLTVQQLSDREEIREAILRWSRGVDTGNWELFQQAYTSDLDADFTEIGIPLLPADELLATLRAAVVHCSAIHHVLSNITFHEVGHSMARTSTLCTAMTVPKEGAPFQIGCWYHDELRRIDQSWRICRRKAQRTFHTFATDNYELPGIKKW